MAVTHLPVIPVPGIQTLRTAPAPAETPLGETTTATVLFVDLRGYTGIAERLPAARVMNLLEEFCTVLVGAIESHQGVIYHIAGDGMMAGFGLRGSGQEGACAAFAAGRAMVSQFGPIAARWRDELLIDTGIGIGIHLGEVATGVLGPVGRKVPTLVGDTVNVAARLCNRARAGEVLFTDVVAAAMGSENRAAGSDRFLQLPRFELRGRMDPLHIWCLPAVERLAV